MLQSKAISVSGLKKSYKDLKVLEDVSFSVQKGSIFALLGSNGAGKTTVIRILTTLLKPDAGYAQVCGFNVLERPEQVREAISLTGQYAAVDDILTGRENMQMIGKLRHLNDVAGKINELLLRFALTEAADRHVATYSGGMRRRLDLAMSLLGSPSVVFLDEPTTGLDPQARTAMWKIIKELAQSGVTVFLTTQYLEEADVLADYIAILHHGKIVAQGSADQLKKMLPHGHIELRFRHENEVTLAGELLSEYNISLDRETLTLNIVTDGSVRQMMDTLVRLEQAGISATEFMQKSPTLDDVFLSVIGEDHAKEGTL
ncbi:MULTISPECIES: ATP-binding cassette domain-containing protein [unclassified Dehalobacter]|uniref:ATP-binding cassette domain-containing protein n=1 Tax=unclassified Dehalobacter TaxID=2635733 RepID=UPI000E6D3D08|nr:MULTISPECIES: ATP-binding cassette domain-containing protein [unclassified Dehalobacter]RJE47163.1 ABC transporter [Dehalobacter sp. MCB1]TCX53674.1 ABC transporter [Dehalobacter sp. 14DCB1]TCX54977.1 ABC transporter [Dehalobacter sp. 12DCB1]